MNKNLFFLSRGTNEFERYIAIIDKVGFDYNSTIFYTAPLFRLVNRGLSQILDCNYNFIDLSSFSILEKCHHFFIFKARKYKSSKLASVAVMFKTMAENKSRTYAKRILDAYDPSVLITVQTDLSIPVPIFKEIVVQAKSRNIPSVIVSTGIGVFASEYTSRDTAIRNSVFPCDYFCTSGKDEVNSYYFPHIVLNGPYKACLAMGDPKSSKVFLKKLIAWRSTFVKNVEIKEKAKAIAIFGNNLPNFGDVIEQDVALLRIVKWVLKLGSGYTPYVKFHPNTSHNNVKQQIIDLGINIISNDVNSIELLDSVDYYISPPTTVMFEAFILDKKILVVDDLEDRPYDSETLGFPSVRSENLSEISIDDIKSIQNKEKVSRHIWGEIAQDDCRENYKELFDHIVSENVKLSDKLNLLNVNP